MNKKRGISLSIMFTILLTTLLPVISVFAFEKSKENNVIYEIYGTSTNEENFKRSFHEVGESNLYYELNGDFWPVSVEKNEAISQEGVYSEIENTPSHDYYFENQTNIHYYDKQTDQYYPLIVEREDDTYHYSAGTALENKTFGSGETIFPEKLDYNNFYLVTDETEQSTEYQYSYEDGAGKKQLGESLGESTIFETIFFKKNLEEEQEEVHSKEITSIKKEAINEITSVENIIDENEFNSILLENQVQSDVYNPYGRKTNEENYEKRHNDDNSGEKNLWYRQKDGNYTAVYMKKKIIKIPKFVQIKEGDQSPYSGFPRNSYYFDNKERLYYQEKQSNIYDENYSDSFKKISVTRSRDFIPIYSYTVGSEVISEGGFSFQQPNLPVQYWPLYIKQGQEYDIDVPLYTYEYEDTDGNRKTIGESRQKDNYLDVEFYAKYDKGISVRKDAIYNNETGMVDIKMEAWKSMDTELNIPAHDIVIVLDQSQLSGEGKDRENIIKEAKKFTGNLDTEYSVKNPQGLKPTTEGEEHNVAIVGYGRIGNQSGNHNTGYYDSNKKFISDKLDWKEVPNFDVLESLPVVSGLSKDDVFMTPTVAHEIFDLNTIKPFNAGAARLDAGLVLMNEILKLRDNNTRPKMVVVFSQSLAMQNDGKTYRSRVAAVETAINELVDTNTTVLSVGDYKKWEGVKIDDQENLYEKQMDNLTLNSGKSVDNPGANGFRFSLATGLDKLSEKMGQILAPNTAPIEIKDVVTEAFEIKVDSVNAYTVPFAGSYVQGEPQFGSERTTVCGTIHSVDCNKTSINDDKTEVIVGPLALSPIQKEESDQTEYLNAGAKLVVEMEVKPKDGFIGGNQVITNSADSGVYEIISNNRVLAAAFPIPKIDVPLKNFDITVQDKNVYLTKCLTLIQAIEGSIIKSTDNKISLDLKKNNYGLNTWQYEYVDIQYNAYTSEDDAVPDECLGQLIDDKEYQIKMTISPNKEGKIDTQTSKSNFASINVFKPEITYEDLDFYYGDTKIYKKNTDNGGSENPVINYETAGSLQDYLDAIGQKENIRWKHATSNGEEIVGDPRVISFDYKFGEEDLDSFINNNIEKPKINAKKNIPVSVNAYVEIGDPIKGDPSGNRMDITEYLTVKNSQLGKKEIIKSDNINEVENDNPKSELKDAFSIYANTASLEITKKGGIKGDPYIFNIYKDNEKYTEVSIIGTGESDDKITISELPVGIYTIEEDTNWSWRYEDTQKTQKVTLSREDPLRNVIFESKIKNNNWLNYFDSGFKNIFGNDQQPDITN